MDSGLLATLRIHNPWLDRPEDQQALLGGSLPHPFLSRLASLRLDKVEDGITVRFVRPWEIDLVLDALEH